MLLPVNRRARLVHYSELVTIVSGANVYVVGAEWPQRRYRGPAVNRDDHRDNERRPGELTRRAAVVSVSVQRQGVGVLDAARPAGRAGRAPAASGCVGAIWVVVHRVDSVPPCAHAGPGDDQRDVAVVGASPPCSAIFLTPPV